MRICMLNWPLVFHGALKGGIAGYTQVLALELIERGHRVSTVGSGTTYTPRQHSQTPKGRANGVLGKLARATGATRPAEQTDQRIEPGPCTPVRHPDWFGMAVYEITNSPVLAPSLLQFNEPMAEVSSPKLEAVFGEIIALEKPDVLHVQSLEGFSLGCLDVARRVGCRIIYSLHNYHPLCPQVYLTRGHRAPCTNYDGGRACNNCVPAPDAATERNRRAAAHPNEPPPFEAPSNPAPPLPPTESVALEQSPPKIDPEADPRGMSALLRSWQTPRHWCTPDDPNWQPFDNVPRAEPTIEGETTDYARRRAAFIEALNHCDTVHAVSSFVAGKFVAHGVDEARVKTLTIGTIANDLREHNAELAFAPPPRPTPASRPLRAVFIGVNHWYKGLSMLADSLEMLTPDVLGSIELSVFAAGGQTIEYRFRRLEPRLARLRYGYEYGPQDLPWMCGGQDVGLVPSVWWDNGPQTVLEMQANGLPVLGANAGGIPDFVQHEANGLLFNANDRFDLAGTLARCVNDPPLVVGLRSRVRPPKTMAEHAREMEPLYAGGVS
ncbi:MAG: glycosyltransferase [Phycisphaerales bacterium]